MNAPTMFISTLVIVVSILTLMPINSIYGQSTDSTIGVSSISESSTISNGNCAWVCSSPSNTISSAGSASGSNSSEENGATVSGGGSGSNSSEESEESSSPASVVTIAESASGSNSSEESGAGVTVICGGSGSNSSEESGESSSPASVVTVAESASGSNSSEESGATVSGSGRSGSNSSEEESSSPSSLSTSKPVSATTSKPPSSTTPAACTKPSASSVPCYVDNTCNYTSSSSQIGTPCCTCGKGVENLFLKPLISLNPVVAKPPIKFSCPTPKGLCLCSGLPNGVKRCFVSIGAKKLGISIYPYTNSGLSQFYSYQTGCTAGSGITLIGTAVKFQYLCANQNSGGKPRLFPLLSKPSPYYFRPTVFGCGGCLNIGQAFTCQGPTAPSAKKIFGF